MKCWIVVMVGCLLGCSANGQSVRVGLFQGLRFSIGEVQLNSSGFDVLVDGIRQGTVDVPTTFKLSYHSGKVSALSAAHTFSGRHKIEFRARQGIGAFDARSLKPDNGLHGYEGNLVVRHRKGNLLFILESPLEQYVAGVVQAETGNGRKPEFYKAQAVISRTYALNNLRRHEKEGFHVCDQTHCQVFHGTSNTFPAIVDATINAAGLVIVDHNIELITAAFHANCGGQTVDADFVWSRGLPYLKSVRDTFCLHGVSSHWEHRIPTLDWERYLASKAEQLPDSTSVVSWQPANKTRRFQSEGVEIPLPEMRNDLGLRSCWFSVHQDGDETVLTGRGFGHGVGMCQQGAIRMAETGLTFRDILHHYYTGVHVIPMTQMGFFQSSPFTEP